MRSLSDSLGTRGRWTRLASGILILSIFVPSASGFSLVKPNRKAPTIASFTPASGKVGTKVTITGNRFLIGGGGAYGAGTSIPVGVVMFGTVAATNGRSSRTRASSLPCRRALQRQDQRPGSGDATKRRVSGLADGESDEQG